MTTLSKSSPVNLDTLDERWKCEWGIWHISARWDQKGNNPITFGTYFEELPTPVDVADVINRTADKIAKTTQTEPAVVADINKGVRAFRDLADAIIKIEGWPEETEKLGGSNIDLPGVGYMWMTKCGLWRKKPTFWTG